MFAWFENRIDAFRDVPFPDGPTTLRRFVLHFVRQVPLLLVALAVLACIQAAMSAAVYVYIGHAVDVINAAVAGTASTAEVDVLLYQVPVVLAVQLVASVLSTLVTGNAIQPAFPSLVRWQSHRRVSRQSMSFFQSDFAGRVAGQVMDTGQSIQGAVLQFISAICQLGVFIISVVVILTGLYWVFLVPLAAWLAVCWGTMWLFIPRMQSRSKANAEARNSLMGRIVDAYSNMMTVKLFAGPDREDDYILEGSRTLLDRVNDTMRLNSLGAIVFHIVNAGLMVSIFVLAISEWRRGSLPIGGVVVATAMAFRLQDLSWFMLGQAWNIFSNLGTVQNAMKTVAEPLPVRPLGLGRRAPAEGPSITLSDVRFAYASGKTVIDGVSLAVAAREKVGIVGPSGAGKSTVVGLVAGLYAPVSGTITIDGCDSATMSDNELRALFSVVSQDTSLFNRSIRENILYGSPGSDEARLRDALAKAKADEFIADLVDKQGRKGLDAHIGERGVRLSAGQRQRIAIARAILKDAPILLLDEASSALDSATEEHIQGQLATLMDDKTVLVVAHRLSTLTRMDRIVVMDRGRVVEVGTHDALLSAGGLYRDLWQLQARTAAAA